VSTSSWPASFVTCSWRSGPGEAAAVGRFFTDATVAGGVVAMDATEGPFKRGVGVIVNDDDPVLGRCFELRDRLDEQTFQHAWRLRDASWGMRPSHAPARTGPLRDHRRPDPARSVHPAPSTARVAAGRRGDPCGTAAPLRRVRHDHLAGASSVARHEAARRRMGSAFDVLSRCLPVGVSHGQRVESVEQALTHAAPAGTGEEHRRGPPAFRAPREAAVARPEG
jgi:hypothetical protein